MKNNDVKNTGILRMARTQSQPDQSILDNKLDVNVSPIARKQLRLYFLYLLAASYPLTFGDIGKFSNILWIEILAPIVFFVTLLNVNKSLIPIGARFSVTAVLLLVACSIGHYIFHPVVSQNLSSGVNVSGGIRAYYGIVVCTCIFFSALWMTAYKIKHDADWRSILRFFLWASFLIGYARLITYLAGVNIPMMAGVFGYQEMSYLVGGAHRIGGLSECGVLGLAALLALNFSRKWSAKNYIFLCSLLFLMVMSGGRASIIAAFIVLVIYFIVLRREFGKAILFVLFLLAAALVALQFDIVTTQYERLSNIGGGIESNKAGRGVIYAEMWRIFLGNPIFGKGIGSQFVSPGLPAFAQQQVVMGGHGAYMSLLSLYGIVGIIHFIANLLWPIKTGINRLRKRSLNDLKDSGLFAMLTFVVVSLMILSIEFIVGGNGYNHHRLYLFAGISAGILVNLRMLNKQT